MRSIAHHNRPRLLLKNNVQNVYEAHTNFYQCFFYFRFQFFHSINEILLLNIDVSFAATSFVLADLAQHQAIQHKVRQEIDKILQGSDPSTYPDLDKKLPYMEMVLKESARMHPALSLSLPEKTVKPITELGGYQIPSGVRKVIVFRLKDCLHLRFSALQLAPWSMF